MELIKAVREIHHDFPVILATGFSDHIDEDRAAKENICFLGKAINSKQLLKAIDSQLRR